jgi:hypothetical protein
MLRDCNGRPYKTLGSLQQFDPENNVHNLFNLWDQEAIKIGGSPIMYYECLINFTTIDKLYGEARDKLFSSSPIQLWGFYEPVPSQNYQNTFGIDSPEEMVFEFNYRAVLTAIGHPPKRGSRLFTPHKRENWIVIQPNMGEWKMWGELRIQLLCQKFQESITSGEGKITQQQPDFRIN